MFGAATIVSAYIESQYPPDAATDPCETITGFFPFAFFNSSAIKSEANASPPGESTRSTIAFTFEFFTAASTYFTKLRAFIPASNCVPPIA